MPALVLVADDLTGALDSAVAFAARGMSVTVARGAPALEAALARDPQVLALSTGTREIPAAQARRIHAALAPRLAGTGAILVKKVDSRLKGNIAAELDGLLAGDPRPVLALPALPRLGRIVAAGQVTGHGVAMPIAVAPRLGRPARIPDCRSAAEMA
ncbi:four-carbon acid sugar kinase family protein, partial [Mangrovicoccus algicola]|nr:hypothetical protein [Mangrovicoccus algicola]